MTKYKLSFINKGKPFLMPKWTVGKHKAALAEMMNNCSNLSDQEKEEEFTYYVIYQTLKQIDPSVSIDDIKSMHPEDVVPLFDVVYNAGKEGIYFREGKNPRPKKSKSTGKSK